MGGSITSKRILILNQGLSGVNKYIFSELKEGGWELIFVEVPFPKKYLFQAMISSFRPNVFRWKQKTKEKLSQIHKSYPTFIKRTKFCQKIIKKFDGKFDVIFQISGMFAPALDYQNLTYPFVTFNDYTMALSKKYPDWASPPSELQNWLAMERSLYENAKYIFTCSENTRNSFVNDYGIKAEKVISLKYGVTSDEVLDFPKTYDGKTILFVGKDFKRKGGYVLLEAFKKVRKVINDAKLVIVGTDKIDPVIKQPGVEMLGYLRNKNDLQDLYKQASVFVMPSLCEPFGLVFLEAMRYKLPCVGTTVDAMSEIIEDSKTGFLVPPGDVNLLTDRIITLLNDPALSAEMGMKGFNLLNQKFRWDDLGDKINHYLNKCIDLKD